MRRWIRTTISGFGVRSPRLLDDSHIKIGGWGTSDSPHLAHRRYRITAKRPPMHSGLRFATTLNGFQATPATMTSGIFLTANSVESAIIEHILTQDEEIVKCYF